MSLRPCLLLLTVLLVACTGTPARQDAPTIGVVRKGTAVARTSRAPVTGELRIPAGLALGSGVKLVSDRGAGLVSDRGAGLISDRGVGLSGAAGGLQAAPGFRLQAVEAAGVEGARIFVADAAGQPVPQLEEARTDGRGRFQLPGVPANENFVVVGEVPTREGRKAVFRTLVKVGRLGATTRIDPASTLVTTKVLEGLPQGELGAFNPVLFSTAAETTARQLTAETLPDFTDLLAVRTRMEAITREVEALRRDLEALRAELAAMRQGVDATSPAPSEASPVVPGQATPVPKREPVDAPRPASTATAAAPTPPPKPAPECDTIRVVCQVPDQRVTAIDLYKWSPEGPLKENFEGGVDISDNEPVSVPAGCPLWLVYRDRTNASLLPAVPYTFTFSSNGRTAVLPPPKVSEAPQPTATPKQQATPTPAPQLVQGCGPPIALTFELDETSRIVSVAVSGPGAARPFVTVPVKEDIIEVDAPTDCLLVFKGYAANGSLVDTSEMVVSRDQAGKTLPLPLKDPLDERKERWPSTGGQLP